MLFSTVAYSFIVTTQPNNNQAVIIVQFGGGV